MDTTQTALMEDRGGYQVTRFNALRHGVLSRFTVLPWEEEGEYRDLLEALIAEHAPQGPTEEHLVEELAGVIWRKRRLRQAEGAALQRGLKHATSPYEETVKAALAHLNPSRQIEKVGDAITATTEETEAELADLHADEAMTSRALELLAASKAGAYERAMGELREDTRDWWAAILARPPDEYDEGERPYDVSVAGLHRFLETEVMSWYETRRKELQNRPLIRMQALGEALDPDRLEGLARYEVHLDRKLERTLAMLVRLKELRSTSVPG